MERTFYESRSRSVLLVFLVLNVVSYAHRGLTLLLSLIQISVDYVIKWKPSLVPSREKRLATRAVSA